MLKKVARTMVAMTYGSVAGYAVCAEKPYLVGIAVVGLIAFCVYQLSEK